MKSKNNHPYAFQLIAPIYGWFFKMQKKRFKKDTERIMNQSILDNTESIVDIGCGTGALASALNESGFNVMGIDPVMGMLRIARKKTKGQKIKFVYGNILNGLDIPDLTFDISIASYVAHGLKKTDRIKMYKEMKRITKKKVLLYEYNQNRNIISDVIEFIEGGDYFNFIKDVKEELRENFSKLTILPLNKMSSLYICDI